MRDENVNWMKAVSYPERVVGGGGLSVNYAVSRLAVCLLMSSAGCPQIIPTEYSSILPGSDGSVATLLGL